MQTADVSPFTAIVVGFVLVGAVCALGLVVIAAVSEITKDVGEDVPDQERGS